MSQRSNVLTAIAVAGFVTAAALGAGFAYIVAGFVLR